MNINVTGPLLIQRIGPQPREHSNNPCINATGHISKVKVKVYQFQKQRQQNRNAWDKSPFFSVCPPAVLVLGRPVKQWSSCGSGGHTVCRLLCILHVYVCLFSLSLCCHSEPRRCALERELERRAVAFFGLIFRPWGPGVYAAEVLCISRRREEEHARNPHGAELEVFAH